MKGTEMSSENKVGFTPGPWYVIEGNEHHGPYITHGGWDDICNCYVLPHEGYTGDDKDKPFLFQGQQAEANAHLIAAAPDMYKTLERCVAVIGAFQNPHPEEVEAREYALKTLAKARGEQSK